MRSILLLLLSFAIAHLAHTQKTELRANAYSGLFFFRGSGSTSHSTVFVGDDLGYFNPMPFGRKSDFSYSLELQIQKVTRQNHLYGIGISFERLTSRSRIDSTNFPFQGTRPADGKVNLTSDFITLNPFIGQRILSRKVILDLQLGVDFSFSTRVYDQAKITSGNKGNYGVIKDEHPIDIRPRLQLGMYRNKLGLLLGYSMGTTNLYRYGNPSYDRRVYANYLRVGISYQLK